MNAQTAGNGTCGGCGGGCSGAGSCGCGWGCGGPGGATPLATTPLPTSNLPGRPALSHRVGTRPAFMAAMSGRLSRADHPQLAALRTRDLSDASMAMLDAWATAADVLTFYQERICNEGYLGTAVEQRSVRELAALVGWRPRPGVAATAYLAYTVDPNSTEVLIPAGARANSIPAPGETMQAFETSDDLAARSEWNALRPRMVRDQSAASIAANGLYLAGTATGLAVNDALVLGLGSGNLTAVRVKAVTVDNDALWTHVDLQGWFGGDFALQFQVSAVTEALQALRVAAGTATADRVTAALTEVLAKLGTAPPQELADWVSLNTLPAIHDELDAARERGYVRLVPALEQALAAMEPLAGHPGGTAFEASGSGAAFSGASFWDAAAKQGEAGRAQDKRQNPLDRLVGQLLLPGSVPPATPQNLDRSYTSTFAGSGEVFPQLLTGLHARLAPTLYQALSGAAISAPTDITVWALRKAAPLFGNNAPVPGSFDGGIFYPATSDWVLAGDEGPATAFLDTAHPTLQAGELAVMEHGSTDGADAFSMVLTTVKSVRTASRFAYGLAGRSTSLVFADEWWKPLIARMNIDGSDGMDVLRASTAYVQQEGLALAQEPVTDDVAGNILELDGLYDGLKAGRWVIVSGERSDVDLGGGAGAIHASELLMLAAVVHSGASDDGQILAGESRHTFLTFAQPLAYSYKRDTVTVCGNVAHATHGQSTAQVLGAGNAAAALQQFTLSAPPLTYIAAPTPAGTASTLVVRVNGVQWPEVPGLAYLEAGRRGFFTSTRDGGIPEVGVPGSGGTTVTFGNPPHGQRLPTGADNVRAAYRSGIGAPGNVAPGQITQLATRPLGVTAVTNPLASSGGADPETREATRANAPLAVTALDRLVSVSDYAAFAATFAGVGKASSALLHAGGSALVQVTVAGVDDAPIDATSDTFRNLRSALTLYGDQQLRVNLVVREELALVLSANIKVAADYDWTVVEPAVRAALLAAFGFDAMALGQDLPSSAVISAMAAVPGVDYVDLDVLTTLADTDLIAAIADLAGGPPPAPGAVPRRIPVAGDRVVAGVPLPAQLACLQASVPDSLILNEVQP